MDMLHVESRTGHRNTTRAWKHKSYALHLAAHNATHINPTSPPNGPGPIISESPLHIPNELRALLGVAVSLPKILSTYNNGTAAPIVPTKHLSNSPSISSGKLICGVVSSLERAAVLLYPSSVRTTELAR